ncbi:putative methyltransferase-domain-containing protein [Mycena pura]|uniref:Methyltransferase-domain-containing protein n=1 Tax=Mycena pura TaxID=153505 RepID=A0AAD6YN34_9AGAR|nr:putative methyltransferase-domain-containing protein [Mycena pura]
MEDDLALDSVFPEEERPPSPKSTIAVYERDNDIAEDDWRAIKIRLVGSHPLWGHHLWNAARAIASYLDHTRELYRGQLVLELGAGGGLPGLVAAKNGAQHVLLTDYPDGELVANLESNVGENIAPSHRRRVSVLGYIWGRSVEPLIAVLPSGAHGFHLIILSDLLFNHSQHEALLDTCEHCLAPTKGACVLVFYTHHRPHLAHRDMEFFAKARSRGWICDEVVKRSYQAMFAEDGGDESVRSTVHGMALRRS